MTVEQLQYFLALAQCRNFTMAANQMYISQPALSKSISALEKELQMTLVLRNTREVTLTPAGESFQKTCQNVLMDLRNGINEANSSIGKISGKVLLGISSEFPEVAISAFINEIRKVYPLITLDMKFYRPNGLLRAIDNNTLDMIFTSDMPRDTDLDSLVLSTNRRCIVIPTDHPLADRTSLTFQEVRNDGLVLIDNMISGYEHDIAIETARAGRCSPHLKAITRSIPETLMRVACHQGITILSDKYQNLSSDVVFIPIPDAEPIRNYLVWRKSENECIRAISELTKNSYNSKALEKSAVSRI